MVTHLAWIWFAIQKVVDSGFHNKQREEGVQRGGTKAMNMQEIQCWFNFGKEMKC